MQHIRLLPATPRDAERIHTMKYAAFLPLYQRYHDDETNPVTEPLEKVIRQLQSESTHYYLIEHEETVIGAIRIVHDGIENGKAIYRISPFFILPAYQNQGFGYAVMRRIFTMYDDAQLWRLSTIQQEKGNCHLYEKCGFSLVGNAQIINDAMTIVYYEKRL